MLAVDTTSMAANAYENCPSESQPTSSSLIRDFIIVLLVSVQK